MGIVRYMPCCVSAFNTNPEGQVFALGVQGVVSYEAVRLGADSAARSETTKKRLCGNEPAKSWAGRILASTLQLANS